MKVALYDSHHSLPFWSNPKNPYGLYDPKHLEGLFFQATERRLRPASEHYMVPVLNGLLSIDYPGIMAHVSIILNYVDGEFRSAHRVWVQFTSEPVEWGDDRLPVVVKDGVVQVEHLWGRDNGTHNPFGFLGSKSVEGEDTPEFWADFFMKKLYGVKIETQEEVRNAMSEIARLERIIALIP